MPIERLDPVRPVGSTQESRPESAEALAAGGSSLRDHRQADGALGYFQKAHLVYGREGEPCRSCETPIRRRVQGGRSTFYCRSCQR